MKVIECPRKYEKESHEVAVFMGGGMSNTDWHNKFLNELDKIPNSLVVYNPYNPNIYQIKDQIEWEFEYLNKYINDYFIFSVYFDKYTKQPISMYELGRACVLSSPQWIKVEHVSVRIKHGFPMIISFHPDSPIKEELKAQLDILNIDYAERSPEEHARQVMKCYKELKRGKV